MAKQRIYILFLIWIVELSLIGCKKSSTEPEHQNQPPYASFSYMITGQEVQFTDESKDTDGNVTSWYWKFGDSFSSNVQNPIHRYVVAGNYGVVLVVSDNEGTKDSVSNNITLTFPYLIYSDSGSPSDADVWTWSGADWSGPTATFDGNFTGENPPEGTKCFKTISGSNWGNNTNYAGWGVFLAKSSDHIVKLSLYSYLKFWIKTPQDIKIEIQQINRFDLKSTVYISNYGWDHSNNWQEITIPASAFIGTNLSQTFCPFMITVEEGNKTFYVDHVRWTN